MKSLDKKLKKQIVVAIANGVTEYRPEGKPIEEIADVILKTFIDAGWNPPVTDKQVLDIIAKMEAAPQPSKARIVFNDEPVMTGREWHQRFENNLSGIVFPHHCSQDQANVLGVLETCRIAAKKASELS